MTRTEAMELVRLFKKTLPTTRLTRKEEGRLAQWFIAIFRLGEHNQVIMRHFPLSVLEEELMASLDRSAAADDKKEIGL